VPLDGGGGLGPIDDDPDFDISQLGGFGEVRRADERFGAINNNAFRMKAGAGGFVYRQAAGIVKHLRQPWAWPFVPKKTIGKTAQQSVVTGRITRGTPNVEAKADGEVGALSHTVGKYGKNLAALMYRESDDQDAPLCFCEQPAQDDPRVARRANDVGAARHEFDGVATPSLFRPQRIKQQRGMMHTQTQR
jgi:hypothetical protein